MRHFFVLIMLTHLLSACKGEEKTDSRIVYNKDFKWTITIPAGFDTVSTEKLNEMQQRGMAEVEKTHNLTLENHTKNIFIFKNDEFNYFQSNYQPFDTLVDGNHLETFKAGNDIAFETLKAKLGEGRVDSVYSTQTISGLEFQSIKIVLKMPNDMIMSCHMYSRIFGKKRFTVNIMTMDPQKEKELLKVWTNSKFDN